MIYGRHPVLQAMGNYLIVRQKVEFESRLLKTIIRKDEIDQTQTVWTGEIVSIGANILERDRLIIKAGAAPEGWTEIEKGDIVLIRPNGCRRLKESDLWLTEINSVVAVLGPHYREHCDEVKRKAREDDAPVTRESDEGDETTGQILL